MQCIEIKDCVRHGEQDIDSYNYDKHLYCSGVLSAPHFHGSVIIVFQCVGF